MKRIVNMSKIAFFSIWILSALSLEGCKSDKNDKEYVESMNSGTMTAYCDDAIFEIMQTPFQMYEQGYPDVDLTIEKTSAREAMKRLFAGKARAAVVSRDYLPDELKLMKEHSVEKHARLHIADDALVFAVNKAFPLDSLHADKIKDYLTKKDVWFKNLYPGLRSEPKIVVKGINSAEYANLRLLCAEGENLTKKVRHVENIADLKNALKNNDNLIGVGYLSQFVKDTSFKLLSVSFVDSTGKHVNPAGKYAAAVHQTYIVMGLYPYVVKYYGYLLEDRRNLPYWFVKHLAIESKVQQYFNDYGIAPAYAKVRIIPQD